MEVDNSHTNTKQKPFKNRTPKRTRNSETKQKNKKGEKLAITSNKSLSDTPLNYIYPKLSAFSHHSAATYSLCHSETKRNSLPYMVEWATTTTSAEAHTCRWPSSSPFLSCRQPGSFHPLCLRSFFYVNCEPVYAEDFYM